LPDNLATEDIAAVIPEPFGRFLAGAFAEAREIRERSISIPRLGDFIGETTRKVKAQYEAHPYPRWRGTALFPNGQYIQHLEDFFSKPELAFTRTPFEVLIAGCGTGLQAVSAALDYGRQAQVTGLDISAASLGYAGLMANRMDADNLALVLGDIGGVRSFQPSWSGRFSVIECCGVLHHMADPFGAWRDLLDCLTPGGIMLVGLYSAIARRDLDVLRQEAIYPGADCDDAALRAYRRALLARGPSAPGASYLKSRDIFTTSGFRDFFLHVSEKPTTIPEIQRFLDANGLAFRGFVNVPFGALRQRFPDEAWPGRLERWAELEAERPQLFIGMYQFWVRRRRA
jgi:SAM-dependent methyltransferase